MIFLPRVNSNHILQKPRLMREGTEQAEEGREAPQEGSRNGDERRAWGRQACGDPSTGNTLGQGEFGFQTLRCSSEGRKENSFTQPLPELQRGRCTLLPCRAQAQRAHLLASSLESVPRATTEARGPGRGDRKWSSLNSLPSLLFPQNMCPGAGTWAPLSLWAGEDPGRPAPTWCLWARKSQPVQERPAKGEPGTGP